MSFCFLKRLKITSTKLAYICIYLCIICSIFSLQKHIVGLLNDLIIEDLNYDGVEDDKRGRSVFYAAGMKVSVFEDKAVDLQKCEWAKILKD